MRVSFAVSTTPARATALDELLPHVPGARVYVDDPPSGGSWNNYRRALLGAGSDGESWLVSIDDDAQPCRGFVDQVRQALAVCPGDFASFYIANTIMVAGARATGASWLQTTRVVHGLCWAVRASIGREVVEVAERYVRPDYYSGDQRLLVWLIATRRTNHVSLPSLVDHRPDMASIIRPGRHNSERGAAWFEEGPRVRWTERVTVDSLRLRKSTIRRLARRNALSVPVEEMLRLHQP